MRCYSFPLTVPIIKNNHIKMYFLNVSHSETWYSIFLAPGSDQGFAQ
jgi:hypothetical protein